MKLPILAAALLAAGISYASGPAGKVKRTVNIGNPEAMEQLAAAEPELHAKVVTLIHDIENKPIRNTAEWAKANFDAEHLIHTAMLKTSDPPKRAISFVIGDTRFAGTYELPQRERLVPAK